MLYPSAVYAMLQPTETYFVLPRRPRLPSPMASGLFLRVPIDTRDVSVGDRHHSIFLPLVPSRGTGSYLIRYGGATLAAIGLA